MMENQCIMEKDSKRESTTTTHPKLNPLSTGWTKIERKRRPTPVLAPKRMYWCGFDALGKEKWFIELTNGSIISSTDENYHYWSGAYRE
jgi:hypothetical protein